MRAERDESRFSRRAGFTLAEILLAMMVFAIAITTILALLARSIETVDEIVLKDEAMRLSSAVEREMTTNLTFNQVYDAVNGAPSIEMHAFHYRARNDGARTPEPDRTVEDVLVVPFAGPYDPGNLPTAEFEARDGRYYRVRLTLSPTNPTALTATADDYPSAALVLFAEFIPLGGPTLELPSDPRVVYSYNFAVRR